MSSTIGFRDSALLRNAARSSLLWKESAETNPAVELFDLTICNSSLQEAADELVARAVAGRRTRVSFVNSHVINVAAANPAYARVLHGADRLYADGSGMALAARLLGSPLVDNVNGTDLFPLLCVAAERAGAKIFLLGGKPGVAEAAANTVKAMGHPDVIAGAHHGYINSKEDTQATIEKINASGASILLVGMGVPVQDVWIARNCGSLQTAVTMGVGGLFDFFAGSVSRAPTVLRSVGCEWMWRLSQEPGRLWSRYLIGNAAFLGRALIFAAEKNLDTPLHGEAARERAWRWVQLERRLFAYVGPALKRGVDIAGALAALTLFAPIFLATAIAIKLESSGPVFFRQTRVGKNGVPFTMVKFRSMRVGADALHAKMQGATTSRHAIRYKNQNDPRVTETGRFIRRYSIDELPQFWNVLTGDMSLVGPRPALPSEVKKYSASDRDRLLVKPGITCLWQVGGRANIDFVGQVALDRQYVRKRSFFLDFLLLLRTPYAVVFGDGAY
jgi:exopolysaccharide biosynthesis WecB/TagA/CpsF family protein